MKHLVWIIALLLIVGHIGCGTTKGKKIESETLSKIKKGETTKTQVLYMLGSPNSTQSMSGKETYVYNYRKKRDVTLFGTWVSSGGMETQQVTIMFDEKGVVEEVISQSNK